MRVFALCAPLRLPLVPNLQVEIMLTGLPLSGVLTVPEGALHGDVVYLAAPDDTLVLRPVTVAFRQDGLAVIRDGLSPGERVVVDDIAPALPGMRLEPVGAGQ